MKRCRSILLSQTTGNSTTFLALHSKYHIEQNVAIKQTTDMLSFGLGGSSTCAIAMLTTAVPRKLLAAVYKARSVQQPNLKKLENHS